MRMPILMWRREDILWGLFAGAAIVVVIFIAVAYPEVFWQRGSRANFGPDWDCQYVPKSEPVCVKRMPPQAAD